MEKTLFVHAILLFGISISLTVGAERAAAQGPAGAGASAASQDTSHSFNPINWVKRDSKNVSDGPNSDSTQKRAIPHPARPGDVGR